MLKFRDVDVIIKNRFLGSHNKLRLLFYTINSCINCVPFSSDTVAVSLAGYKKLKKVLM